MYAQEIEVDSSITGVGRRTPAAEMITAGIATPFHGHMDLFLAPPSWPFEARFFANGLDGSLPPSSDYLNPAWDDSGWRLVQQPMFAENYTEPPISDVALSGTNVPINSHGGGDGHWVARSPVHLPVSATAIATPGGTGWTAGRYVANSAENLYLVEAWADNFGTFYLTDLFGMAQPLIGLTNDAYGDFQACYIVSAPPGDRFWIADKAGDTSYDGLAIRFSKLTPSTHTGWIVGSIAIGDE